MPPTRPLFACALSALLTLAPLAAQAEEGVRKGPWLMDPRPDAITVMLERNEPGPLRVRAWPVGTAEGDAGAPPLEVQASASVALHEVRLTGLVPGTRYRYEVDGAGLATSGGSFTAPPPGFAPFRFVVYGDTRSRPTVHAAIVRAIRSEGAEFMLHTGDMVEDGRREEQWQEFFDIEHALLREVPLVPVIGNHEIVRRGTSGVDNFRRYMHLEPSSPEPELDHTFAYGNVRLIVANAYNDWTRAEIREWLEGQLVRARREVPDGFVIVAMHWGLCSSGPHAENRMMRAAGIDELFRQHRVDLVLSGHDHLYDRGEDSGLRYIVTGGGGAPLYRPREKPYSQFAASEYHYVRADVERDRIVFTAVRPDGSVLDRCTLTHSGWNCPTTEEAEPAAAPEPATPLPVLSAASTASVVTRSCGCRAAGHTGERAGMAVLFALGSLLTVRARRRREHMR